MLIISVIDKIFEPCKKYVIHEDHGQISIKKFKIFVSELICLITVLTGSQQIYCSIGLWRHSAIFSVDLRLCYKIAGRRAQIHNMVSVNQAIENKG